MAFHKRQLKLFTVFFLLVILGILYYHHFQLVVLSTVPVERIHPLVFRGEVHRPLTSITHKELVYKFVYYKHALVPPKFKSIWIWKPAGVESVNVRRLAVHPLKIGNGDVVQVDWSELTSEVKSTILCLYCPSSRDQLIDYWSLDDMHPHKSMKVALYNIRTDCQFRLFSNATVEVELLAVSDNIEFRDALGTPEHGHLAMTGSPNQMRVQWSSGAKYTPSVLYGSSPDDLQRSSSGSSVTYSSTDLCGGPANMSADFINPGQLHDVLLTDLQPNTKYFYMYGNKDHKFSSVNSFTTPPMHGSKKTIKLIIYGDMDITPYPGSEATIQHVLQEVLSNNISLVLHIGDMSYAMGLGYRWDEWMTMIEPIASRVPYMVSVGNHEQCTLTGSKKDPSNEPPFRPLWGNYKHDSGGECSIPLLRRFHMPDTGNHLFWYTFTYGSVLLIQLSSEHDFRPGSHQYVWLLEVLNRIDHQVTPWVVVTAHRPMYCSSYDVEDSAVAPQIRKVLESILVEHKIDVYIAGHYHAYERTCRVYKSVCTASGKGMVHIVVGTAGAEIDTLNKKTYEWSVIFKLVFGYGRISANRTSFLWEFVSNDDAKVFDSLLLTK